MVFLLAVRTAKSRRFSCQLLRRRLIFRDHSVSSGGAFSCGRWASESMGLRREFLEDLLTLKRLGALEGARRVIEIGSQQLDDSFLASTDLLDQARQIFGGAKVDLGSPSGANFARSAPPSRPFWRSIGFQYATIDLDTRHDAIPLDLNTDQVPQQLRRQFDLVINTGTTEHVANQAQAFRIIHDLTRKGGVMFHEVPAGSWNHGLFNYTPKFFLMLHKQNDYQQVYMRERTEGDMFIRVALRKRLNREFATPLDVPPEVMPLKYRQPWRTIRRIARLP
jgi:SAM-dependent methyltransferase